MECFDEFRGDQTNSERDLQNYQSMYLDLYSEFRNNKKLKKEDISDDIVFEIELVKQVEISIDYILKLFKDYSETQNKEEQIEIKKTLESGIDSSLSMRNKKDLIMNFLERINLTEFDDINESFENYIREKREETKEKMRDFFEKYYNISNKIFAEPLFQ